ncbi:MAG: VOC family protein [Flavobacteriaceae bacterium]|nr:VOC family protein [Flavobacteriaceae bacterium]
MSLGTSSISLAVADIEASYAFYHKLGFEIKDGAIEQNWLILISGKTKIGLFQGMFPTNTITFNPLNARAIRKNIRDQGIPISFESGFDVAAGPCTISITDPDGNPILIDQH